MPDVLAERWLAEVSALMWRERRLMELLAYRLEVEAMVTDSLRDRWVGRAAREVEAVLDRLEQAEVVRAVRVDQLAEELGLEPGQTLEKLVVATVEPWSSLLSEHRRALIEGSQEIRGLAGCSRVRSSRPRVTRRSLEDFLS